MYNTQLVYVWQVLFYVQDEYVLSTKFAEILGFGMVHIVVTKRRENIHGR